MSRGAGELTSVFEIEGTLTDSSTNPGSESGRRATDRLMRLEAAEHATGRHGQGTRSIADLDLLALADPNPTVRAKAFEAMGEMLRQQQADDTDDDAPEAVTEAKPAAESKFRITGDMPFEMPAPREAKLRDVADEIGNRDPEPRFTGKTLREFVEFTVDNEKHPKVKEAALEFLADLSTARGKEGLSNAVGALLTAENVS